MTGRSVASAITRQFSSSSARLTAPSPSTRPSALDMPRLVVASASKPSDCKQLGGARVPRVGQDQDSGPGCRSLNRRPFSACVRMVFLSLSAVLYLAATSPLPYTGTGRKGESRRPRNMQTCAQRELAPSSPPFAETAASRAASPPRSCRRQGRPPIVSPAWSPKELGWPVLGWKIAAMKEEMQRACAPTADLWPHVLHSRGAPASFVHARAHRPDPRVEIPGRQARQPTCRPRGQGPYTRSKRSGTEAVASLIPASSWRSAASSMTPLSAAAGDPGRRRRLGHYRLRPRHRGLENVDIAGQEATLSSNGGLRREGTGAAALDHPMVRFTWLANELSRTGVGMKARQMISTGTLTGMLAPKPGEDYVADFSPFRSVCGRHRLEFGLNSSSRLSNRRNQMTQISWRADPSGVGPWASRVRDISEPTCPFSVQAFGKLDDLLAAGGGGPDHDQDPAAVAALAHVFGRDHALHPGRLDARGRQGRREIGDGGSGRASRGIRVRPALQRPEHGRPRPTTSSRGSNATAE